MADESKTIILPDNQSSGWNSGIPLALALNGNGLGWNNGYPYGGGLFGGSGFGAGILGGLLGGLIWNGVGFGNWGMNSWGNGGGAAAASLGAQATAIGNTDTILRAIDGTDSDVRLLATTLNSDVNTVKTNLATLQNGLTALTGQTGLSAQQIINAIQAGDASLAANLCSCCCEMKQLVTSQGYENQLATLRQTETLAGAIADLKSTMIDQFCAAEKRDMQQTITRQGDIITQLRNEADNARQTNAIAGMIAPLAREVDDIKCKLPSTATVQYPNLVAVNATPYVSGGYYQGGFGGGYYGPGWGGFGNGVVF
jgi:hypothetical protein